MPQRATTEFWRDLKPIAKPMKPDALPDQFIAEAATDDDRYYAPFSETVGSRPLWINVKDNSWAGILRATSAGMVNRHYHPHEVFSFTISGRWGYLEQDWVATRGAWLYEPPGQSHTLVAYESEEPMRAYFIVKAGLGAACIDSLIR